MRLSDIPTRFAIPFANSAGGSFIRPVPVASQIGVQAGAASLTDGFPPVCFSPIGAGGTPPFGEDMNGIINQSTAWDRWLSAGGPLFWDSAWSAAAGGYAQGMVVRSNVLPGNQWISTVDDNVTNPDAAGAGWSPYGISTGMVIPTLATTANYGFFIANDGTLGNAASNATTLADATTVAIFAMIWAGVSNTYAPVFDSVGTPVARGVSAAADFAANRQIAMVKVLARALAVAGNGAGLTNRVLGQTLGAETEALLQANLPNVSLSVSVGSGQGSHNHNIAFSGGGGGGLSVTGSSVLGPNASALGVTNTSTLPAMTGTAPLGGSGTAFSLIDPSTCFNLMVKL